MEMTDYSSKDGADPMSSTNFGFDDDEVKNKQALHSLTDEHVVVTIKDTDDYHGSLANGKNLPDKNDNTDEVEDDKDQGHGGNKFQNGLESLQAGCLSFFRKNSSTIKTIVLCTMVVAYSAYLAYALYYEFGSEASIRLLWVTMTVSACFAICIIQDHFGDSINKHLFQPIVNFVKRHWRLFKWGFILLVIAGYLTFLIVDVAIRQPYNLVSFAGMIVFLVLMFLFSVDRWKVDWQPVWWGLGLQFVFALLVLRTVAGYEAFRWLGDRVQEFMAYSDAGAIFIFGESYTDHFFAMKVLPVIIFFSSVISVLYYLGVMQAVILKISWVMQKTLGTSAGESVNAAGNIFVGMTEAPLLIRPLINNMSTSELHAVNVGGFATIAGSVMATYILIGVPANHLMTASIMAAPCALGLSKLVYPEKLNRRNKDAANMEMSPDQNVMEAAASGAIAAITLCANIAANLIAFISILAFINATLIWFGERVGLIEPQLTFEFICSYLLWPLALMMGAATEDCRKVAELIGVKIFINEFVAYTELSKIISNTEVFDNYKLTYGNLSNWTHINDDIFLPLTNTTLVGGVMQQRSIVLSTYALCGFANVGAIGIMIGSLSGMVPHRRSEIAKLAPRAMIVGNVVSFMNACTAGLLYQE